MSQKEISSYTNPKAVVHLGMFSHASLPLGTTNTEYVGAGSMNVYRQFSLSNALTAFFLIGCFLAGWQIGVPPARVVKTTLPAPQAQSVSWEPTEFRSTLEKLVDDRHMLAATALLVRADVAELVSVDSGYCAIGEWANDPALTTSSGNASIPGTDDVYRESRDWVMPGTAFDGDRLRLDLIWCNRCIQFAARYNREVSNLGTRKSN